MLVLSIMNGFADNLSFFLCRFDVGIIIALSLSLSLSLSNILKLYIIFLGVSFDVGRGLLGERVRLALGVGQ